ncbi:MAG TPA: hypothetical protein VJ247_01235, partial [Gaiella sp.]|nr:hypothetical protein [Gaiella sp.]
MWTWIDDLPTTNLRILTSVILASAFVLTLLVAIMTKKDIPIEAVAVLGGFILTMMGLDVAQYVQKRKTFQALAAPVLAADPSTDPPPAP